MDPHGAESGVTDDELLAGTKGWLTDLESALTGQNVDLFRALFHEESYWRDLAAFEWDTRQFWGRDAVEREWLAAARTNVSSNFRWHPDRSRPRVIDPAEPRIELFFAFDTEIGTGNGFAVLLPDRTAKWGMRARSVATILSGLHANPPAPITRRGYEPAQPGESWIEYRQRVRELGQRDPDVLVVGGGQSGLSIAAHLDRLGVSYLVVEKNERPGDSWRTRYSSLALHTPTWANSLPFMPFPPTYPVFMSKDQWANWIDAYSVTMDLNVWCSTEFVSGQFDEQSLEWNTRVRAADGSVHALRPKHVIMALGFTGIDPIIPNLPGLDDFAGEVLHTSTFKSGAEYRGKNVLVIGTATSGHDIALDLYRHGADVFMGQRGPACVVPIDEAENYNREYLDSTVEEVDQRRTSNFIYPLTLSKAKKETERTESAYAEMFDGLRKAGMTLTVGEDGTGWLMRLHRTFSGYYLDVGASEVIIDGGIKILQVADFKNFVPKGLIMADGTEREFDAVVMATGYRNMQKVLEKLVGSEVADRVGPIGGIGDDGEPRNMCRPTGQPHLWSVYGGIMDARKTSEILALQIVANLKGIAPSVVRSHDGGIRPVRRDIETSPSELVETDSRMEVSR